MSEPPELRSGKGFPIVHNWESPATTPSVCCRPELADIPNLEYSAFMRTYILVALGCAFWSFPFAFLLTLILIHGTRENGYGFNYEGRGFSYDLLVLFAIPLLMLAWTMSLGWLSGRGRLTATMTIASSVVAVLAGFSWCAWLILIQV